MKQRTAIEDDFARVTSWIEDYFEHAERYRVLPDVRPGEIAAQLPPSPPDDPEPFGTIMDDFERVIVPGMTHWNHPRFFAYFATSAHPSAIAAEALAATMDAKVMLWRTSPAAAELETVIMRWLGGLLGMPPSWTGIIYDTASVAGFTALAAAREALDPTIRERGLAGRDLTALRVYATAHTHSHIEKAAIALGIGTANVVKVATDEVFRMVPESLEAKIEADEANGLRPMAVVTTVGTTSSTACDDVTAIAAIAKRHGVWLHVDAAYAGVAAMLPEFRDTFAGVERADSFVVNPHKWLFIPMDLSTLFIRDEALLRRAFSIVPEYLTTTDGEVRNYMDYGIQLGRRFRALKLWFALRSMGVKGMRERLREHIALAQEFASWVEADPDWEILAPHPLSVVCFRHRKGDAFNARLLEAVNDGGEAFISHTKLDGVYALRMAIGNLRTTRDDVRAAWNEMKSQAARL